MNNIKPNVLKVPKSFFHDHPHFLSIFDNFSAMRRDASNVHFSNYHHLSSSFSFCIVRLKKGISEKRAEEYDNAFKVVGSGNISAEHIYGTSNALFYKYARSQLHLKYRLEQHYISNQINPKYENKLH